MQTPTISIKAKASCNGLALTLAASCSIVITLLFCQSYWQHAQYILMFLLLFSLSLLFLGILKLIEPSISFKITPYSIRHSHRKGCWELKWSNIRNITQINNTNGITREPLSYVGITVESLDQLRTAISLRLANNLIHEQQPLLSYCVSRRLITVEQATINFNNYACSDGEIIKGPLAGFLHQCELLKTALGAHIYINENSIDRSITAFAQLLMQCKRASNNYSKQEVIEECHSQYDKVN